jgi:Transposase DDE domain
MAALMMSGMCASVQAELDGLFGQLGDSGTRSRAVSAQAFSKARRGLSAELFELARARLISLAQPHIDSMHWNGLRLVAADGSRLRVGTRRGHELRADHYAFALFLPGPELTLHAALYPADGAERQMLFEALDVLQPRTDLLLLDRGYIGNAMVAALAQREIPFCMRVDARNWTCVTVFARSGEAERVVTLEAPGEQDAHDYELMRTPTTVRLIRDVTPSGRVRVLMTSLLDGRRYPAASFGALYHQRWRVEEAFKRLKHRLRLEAVTGLDYLALQQDFGAKILTDNLCTLLSELDAPHDEACASHPNRVYALGALKPILGACLLRVRRCLHSLVGVLAVIHQTRCRIQPSRSYPRPPRKAKPHFHLAYKLA